MATLRGLRRAGGSVSVGADDVPGAAAQVMAEKRRIMPALLVKPGAMSKRDIARLERLGGILAVECADPESAKFVEAPFHGDIDDLSRAAMELLKLVLVQPNPDFTRATLTKWYVDILVSGKRPGAVPPVKR